VGVNLLMIIFLVPETRFHRNLETTALPATDELKESPDVHMRDLGESDISDSKNTTPVNGRTFVKGLDPRSGIDRNTSLISNFLRPFPLALYPACAFALLACRFLLDGCCTSLICLQSL